MFRIREKHLAAMAQVMALETFEDQMVVHLRAFSPWQAKAIGDDGVRDTIHVGIARAGTYGVTNTGLLRYYVELMFNLGSHFDTDPLLPWVGDALRDRTLPDQAARVARLFESTEAYFQAIGRTEGSTATTILRSLNQSSLMDLSVADSRFEEHALGALEAIDPRRCDYLGEQPLRDLVRRASTVAAQHRVETDRGTPLVAGMMFMLGHGFAEDPVYPWIGATLRDASSGEPSRRVEVLERRTFDYIAGMLAYGEERADVRVSRGM